MRSRLAREDSRARSSQAKTQTVMIVVLPVAEAELAERAEELVPVDLALADVQVLVDPGGRAGRVDDVAQPGGRAVVEGVGHVHLGEQVARRTRMIPAMSPPWWNVCGAQ